MKQKNVLGNNLYMLRKIIRYCPGQLLVSIVTALLGSAVSVLNILLLKYILDSITNHTSLGSTILFISLSAAVSLVQLGVSAIFSALVIPRNTQILQQKMQMEMFKKAVAVELKCYEDAEFYNRFTMALQQADSRALSVLQTFTALLSSFFSISALLTLIVTLDPPVLLIVLASVVISFVANVRYIKTQHEYTKKTFL